MEAQMSEQEANLEDLESFGCRDESNAIVLPQRKNKKKKKNTNGPAGRISRKNRGREVEPPVSKSKQRKLKQIQKEKERKAMLAKSIRLLEKYKIRDEDRSLLSSSGTIGQAETRREKRLRAAQFSKAGLKMPEDVPRLKKRKVSGQANRHGSEYPFKSMMGGSCEGEFEKPEKFDNEHPSRHSQMPPMVESHSDEGSILNTSTPGLETQETGGCLLSNQTCASLIPCSIGREEKISPKDQGNSDPNFHQLGTINNTNDISKRALDVPTTVRVTRPKEVEENRMSLPIVMMEQEIMEVINENSAVIICGETGCGKTTQVPQFLFEAGFGSSNITSRKGVIAITQPRRVAVLATAKRVSFELGLRLGKEVGYQVRHDKMLGDKCSIKFMTDGILLRELQSDFLLRKYSVVILDEAHERSLNTDILIGMLSRIIRLRQKLYLEQQDKIISGVIIKPEDLICQLKLVLMSATLRVEDFISDRNLFHEAPPIIEVPTRQYPVTTHFSKNTDVIDYVGQAYRKIMQIHRKLPSGGILVFVTGQREVEYLCKRLRKASHEQMRCKLTEMENHVVSAASEKDKNDCEAIEDSSLLDQEPDVFNTYERDRDDPENDDYLSGSDTESDLDFGTDDDNLMNSTSPDRTDSVLDFLKEPDNFASLKASFDALSENKSIKSSNETSSPVVSPSVEGSRKKSQPSAGRLHVLPLYARLPATSQLRVFENVYEGERLVVVSTNVAETSLTIPGIKYVVDTGREKVRKYNHANGMETYEVQWISKASAAQRAGRAGRTGPGHCYRLYSAAAFSNIFSEFSDPQITQIPVDGVVLLMKFMGINKVQNFPFPTPPGSEALKEAERCLKALGALDNEGRLQPVGKAMAQYPMSPRHSRMLLTVIQFLKTQQGSDRANLVLGYAVAAAAALSFPSPFNMDIEKGHEEANGVSKDETSDSRKREKLSQKKLKAVSREARARFCNPTSDALTISYALQLFELSEDPVEFCRKNCLHHKTMDEMSKLRKQLLQLIFNKNGMQEDFVWNHGIVMDAERAWKVSSDKHPLHLKEEQILGQAICSGWADRVAKRIRRVSELSEMDQKGRAVRYLSCALNETVFLHRGSSVSKTAPEFLVYTELLQLKDRPYMHGVTGVRADWLAKCATSLCNFSAPLADPIPEYEPSQDIILCWVSPTFGPHLWQLPLHRLPVKDDMLRVSLFAYHLLKGNVLPCLKSVQKFLAAPPSSILRPEAAGQRRVSDLVTRLKLGQRMIDSRSVLQDTWKMNPAALYPEILCWFQDKFRGNFEELWSKMQAEAILEV